MPIFELPRERNNARHDDNAPATPVNLVEDLQPRPQTNLARGIVWADILADIAADEAARQQLRDAA
ncbi:hypothetical protein [Actinophytocola glycyrrhizae]|uniref:Uncharacterized protein n=1 Tax=Actinophytocola glycyrrhizae TaxID=2044873 RepID=A0ABV9S5L6_9PSEU